jgi:hypothetical protein
MRLHWRLTPVSLGETGFRAILTGSVFEITRAFRLWQSGSRTPNIGGILTSTFLTLVLLPVLHEWMEKNRSKQAAA